MRKCDMDAKLGKIVGDDCNRLFRAYGSFMEETYGKTVKTIDSEG